MSATADLLRDGCAILDEVLLPHGFRFETRASGSSSGGWFACGAYVRGDRRLTLHVRAALGLVTYHVGGLEISHERYVRAVHGGRGGNAYPGFSDEPLDGFRHLRSDLQGHGAVFLHGTDDELRSMVRRALDAERQAPTGLKALFDADG